MGAQSDKIRSDVVEFDGNGPWVLLIDDWTEDLLRQLGARFDHVGLDRNSGKLRLHVDTQVQLSELRKAGLRLELDVGHTRHAQRAYEFMKAGSEFSRIPGFECYRTVEQTLARGAELAATNPTLATWTDVGDSWEKLNPGSGGAGFDLWALRLTNLEIPGPKPALLATGAIHAREYTTAELVTRFAEKLIDSYGVEPDATWLLDQHEIHLVLVTNPDGRKRAETGLRWRKNANNEYCENTDFRGVDLNRNFEFQWACCEGSSANPCASTFEGPFAGSEPESLAIMNYMDELFADQRPDDLVTPAPPDATGIFLDVHSHGEVILSPWGFTEADPPNGDQLLTLARKYSFFPGYDTMLGRFINADGTTKDYAYGHLGVPGFTVELGTAHFQDCSTFEEEILPENLNALMHMAKNVRAPYVTPSGPDTVEPMVSKHSVVHGDSFVLSATVDDTRYSTQAEPTQSVDSAEAYFDTPPWGGGTPIPMVPSDGAFDTPVEAVEVELSTAHLNIGRHILFVRGADSSGVYGAISAQFVQVVEDKVFEDGFENSLVQRPASQQVGR